MNLHVPLALFIRVRAGCRFRAERVSSKNRTSGGHIGSMGKDARRCAAELFAGINGHHRYAACRRSRSAQSLRAIAAIMSTIIRLMASRLQSVIS